MTKNIEICKAEEVGAQVLDIRTTAERQAVAAINAAFGLAIPLPANEPGEITELPAAVSAHDRQLLAQPLGKPEPAATLSTTDPLATFVATLTRELYRHFAERTADYLPADFPDPFARNLAHLLQAVQSLAPRKISNGNGGTIADGISLAHLMCDSSAAALVTEIDDTNNDWTLNTQDSLYTLLNQFPNATKFTIGASAYTVRQWPYVNMTRNVEIWFPYITNFLSDVNFIGISDSIYGITGASFHFPSIKTLSSSSGTMVHRANASRIYFEGLESGVMDVAGPSAHSNYRIAYIYLGCKGKTTETIRLTQYNPNNGVLQDVEIRQGARQAINVSAIGGLTAENIVNHILDKLADNSDGTTITINIGSTNLAKLTAEQKAIAQNKNYTLA